MNFSNTIVAFDFDGTIVDTELAEHAAWQSVEDFYNAPGIADRVYKAIVFGPQHDPIELAREVAVKAGVPAFEVNSHYRKSLWGHSALNQVRPEALELLEACVGSGARLMICSGATYAWIGSFLQRLELHQYFESACTRDAWEPNHQKADVYTYLRRHYETQGVTTFYAIEDSPRGIVAAHQGGWKPILLPNALVSGQTPTEDLPSEIFISTAHFLQSFSA